MAKGDSLGALPCPCCGGAWVASESKTGGISFTCANGFQGLAKYPRTVASLRARLLDAAPAAPAAPAAAAAKAPAAGRPAPASPAAKRNTFAEWMGAGAK